MHAERGEALGRRAAAAAATAARCMHALSLMLTVEEENNATKLCTVHGCASLRL